MNKEQYKKLLILRDNQELLLFNAIKNKGDNSLRELLDELNIPIKRVCYILDKWSSRNIYEWGTSILSGWLQVDKLPQGKNIKRYISQDQVYENIKKKDQIKANIIHEVVDMMEKIKNMNSDELYEMVMNMDNINTKDLDIIIPKKK